ncbi:Protein-tyrosine phosphatase domain containing protein [Cladophialophora carrionii]|uniref:Protein-tyrosine phosphatase domain containing protein n=1 Tax=Cladophialophora carrionii TaxID=86049 RepID=A0A1C1CDS4_9EURO|nr:Protein-tyrosine phosphatase domain containing protein [Cladophialophora carrionii]
MPQSLTLTPPQAAVKRQRSQELPLSPSRPTSSGQAPSNGPLGGPDDSADRVTVRIPPYLNKTKAKISLAFQELEWKQRFRLQHGFQNPHTSPFRVDRSKTVFKRNRYGNVQPWDASRVRLKKPIGGSDYVNASPIVLKSRKAKNTPGGTSTPVSARQSSSTLVAQNEYRYIATQGPKEGQFSHFWHMVMQETPGDVGVVIMLTQHVEGNKEKCAQYYPVSMENPTMILPAQEGGDEDGEPGPVDDGDPFLDSPTGSADADSLCADSEASQTSDAADEDDKSQEHDPAGSVTLLSSHYDAKIGCEVRKLRLTIDDESKTIYHYYFGGWPDFAKPEAEDRTALLELTKVSKAVAGDAPRIVHCSAGVGRTGTWIALDFLLQELEAGRLAECDPSSSATPPLPNPAQTSTTANGTWGTSGPPRASTPEPKDEEDVIWETVNTLREQRMMMVMNELQYQFIYEVLKEAFIEKYAEKETGPVVVEVQEPSPKVARKKSPSVFGGMYQGTKVGSVKGNADTVSEEAESEAETEVMDGEKTREDADMDSSTSDEEGEATERRDLAASVGEDPYAAVAPETIREGQEKVEQNEIRDHELKR